MSLLQGPEKGTCQCVADCGLFGTLGRPDRTGARHVRGCACRVCMGRRNRRNGMVKQRKATKLLGLSHGQWAGAHEEALAGPLRTEVKATLRHAKPVQTAYELMRAQSEAARSFGDNRPFIASAAPPGSGRVYYVIRDDDLAAVVLALAEVFGASA